MKVRTVIAVLEIETDKKTSEVERFLMNTVHGIKQVETLVDKTKK